MQNIYAAESDLPIIQADVNTRARFITRTYLHLFGAIVGFTLLEVALFASGLAERMATAMLGTSWLVVLGAFMVVSWLASRTAHRARSLVAQYAALAGFVAAEAIIFVPMIFIASKYSQGRVLESAVGVTLAGFLGLTGIAMWTRKDFAFMGALLRWVGFGVILTIVASLIFGFHLGTWFSAGMVIFAGGAILYDTSNVMHHYPEDRYVGASLQLFASVALMFWYVLRLFMSRD